jgi:hypothetical protein
MDLNSLNFELEMEIKNLSKQINSKTNENEELSRMKKENQTILIDNQLLREDNEKLNFLLRDFEQSLAKYNKS